ncbi:hypothetical protein Pint_12038 [Pistacia integerrima]|uniref:Uncharacterized protein n=1 Tax=Pistacia integerrima TaxID=434235 RepID=A0ACC0XG39_9ROSI|nr:hypothetical protein Pint_12038 [Pistacia integerrima]
MDLRAALEAKITVKEDTALHVAVGTGKANHIVKYLLTKMSQHQLTLKNKDGNTLRPDLNRVENNCGFIPLIEAV